MSTPAVTDERRCRCGAFLTGRRTYCSSRCRAEAWRERKQIVGIRYVKRVQNAKNRRREQPRLRYDLAVEAAREAAGLFLTSDAPTAQFDALAEACVRRRLTDHQQQALPERQRQSRDRSLSDA